MPEHLLEVLARFTRRAARVAAVDQRSGVSARFAIAAAETRRRRPRCAAPALLGEDRGRSPGSATCRRSCRTLRGKVEFEMGEEGREVEVLDHLLRRATAETFRARLAGLDLSGFTDAVRRGRRSSRPASWSRPTSCSRQLGTVPGLAKVLDRLGLRRRRRSPGQVAAAVEFALEGLHLTRRIAKDDRRRPHRLRRPDADARPRPVAPHGAVPLRRRGTTGPTRSPRRTTSARRSTRSASDVLAGGSLREALRDLLRRGHRTAARGLDDLRRGPAGCAARRRAAATSTARSTRSAALLDQALAAERDDARRPRTATTPGSPRWTLDDLPDDTAGAVRELADYDWRSPEARADRTSRSRTMLRSEVLDAAVRRA